MVQRATNGLSLSAGRSAIFIARSGMKRPVTARARPEKKRFPILYGADGRRSTSKFTAYTWTAALLFGGVTLCVAAFWNELPLADIGLNTLPEQYLVLLAVPYGSLVAAKLIIQSKVENQRIVKGVQPHERGKKRGPYEEGEFTEGDRGQRSLQDVQYLTFNALLLVVLLCRHREHPHSARVARLAGRPDRERSAALSSRGKAVESETPEIVAVTQNEKTVQVRGKHLHQPVCGESTHTNTTLLWREPSSRIRSTGSRSAVARW